MSCSQRRPSKPSRQMHEYVSPVLTQVARLRQGLALQAGLFLSWQTVPSQSEVQWQRKVEPRSRQRAAVQAGGAVAVGVCQVTSLPLAVARAVAGVVGHGVHAGAVVAARVRLAFVLICGGRRGLVRAGTGSLVTGGDTSDACRTAT